MNYYHPFANALFERKYTAKMKREKPKGGVFIDPEEDQWKQRRKDLFFKGVLEIDPWNEPGGKRQIELLAQSVFSH